jgi:hypothetical protein
MAKNVSNYNYVYFREHKTAILAKRSERRAAMSETEREIERQKARARAACSRDKTSGLNKA